MGSTRLPGKVLMDLQGQTVLARVTGRLRCAASLDEVVVATSVAAADAGIERECERLGVRVFRGNESDVLERYREAAARFQADAVVRITADCPLVDPGVVNDVVEAFKAHAPDYASNVLVRTYPRGLDTEVFSREALERAAAEATQPYQREHVTPYFYEHPLRFRLHPVTGPRDVSVMRWTLDTADDLRFLRAIYARLPEGTSPWTEVLRILEQEPGLAALNAGVEQKALHQV